MIVCGWCNSATEPGLCSSCGRNPALPWTQRGDLPPGAKTGHRPGRPALDDRQVKQRIRIAIKDLGGSPTMAQLAEKLDVSETTARKWRKTAGL